MALLYKLRNKEAITEEFLVVQKEGERKITCKVFFRTLSVYSGETEPLFLIKQYHKKH